MPCGAGWFARLVYQGYEWLNNDSCGVIADETYVLFSWAVLSPSSSAVCKAKSSLARGLDPVCRHCAIAMGPVM